MNIKNKYQQRAAECAAEAVALKRKNSGFVVGELLSFGGLMACLVCYFAIEGDSRLWLGVAFLCLAAYFAIRRLDDKNKEKAEWLSALLKVYEDEVKALEGDFSPFEIGEAFQNPQHPYSFDLDVFGKGSLFNRICRTITSGGSIALKESLTRETPLNIVETRRRTALQRELAEDTDWRMEFLALGERNGKINSTAVADAIQKVQATEVPGWMGSPVSLALGWLLIVGVIASAVLAALGIMPPNIALGWMMAQFILVFGACKQTLDKIDSNGGKLRRQLIAYAQILRLIARRDFHSEMGREMKDSLADALPSFAQLEKILKKYDQRGNFLALFFTDAFLLSDFFLVRRFQRWKDTYMMKTEEWMDIIGEWDAQVSMADFRCNHPEATDAEWAGCPEIVFEVKNLYHPFLGVKAVKNDFTIQDDNYYIITGANMAGKSTFLRSLGANYILAMAGMPVFADHLRLSRFRLFSSMRTTDDLTHGISYFNAELIRLEELLRFCKPDRGEHLRTLIILDEILKGTNSLDKLNGSRRFLEAIAQLPVSGIIATHDLELSKMEETDGGKFHNYCFEIDLGTDVTYTYKIQPGVARNQNATFLLNKILEKY